VLSTVSDFSTLDGYQLRLPVFEGPLDVLLRLIERSHLAITDVSLVSVTEQFLAYVERLGAAPPNVLAEFMAVGSRLVLLKSRSLLPRPPTQEAEETNDDLVHQLIAYRAIKEAAGCLGEWDASGAGAFVRSLGAIATVEPVGPPKLALHEANLLARALRRRFSVAPLARHMVASLPVVSLREMIERVLNRLRGDGPIHFSDVRRTCDNRNEVLTAFLAVLVLLRRRVVDVGQHELFGEIQITRNWDEPASVSGALASMSADD
jgi:segregation and condensation protein A